MDGYLIYHLGITAHAVRFLHSTVDVSQSDCQGARVTAVQHKRI